VNHDDEVMAASVPLVESSANLHTSVLDRFQVFYYSYCYRW